VLLKSLTLPLILTLSMHGALVAAFLMDWSGERTVIKRQTPRYVEARLVTLEKPKPKPKVVKKVKKPKAAIKPIIDAKPTVKPKPKVLASDKIDPAKLAQEQKRLAEQKRLQQEKQALLDSVASDLDAALDQEQQEELALTEAELVNNHVALISQAIIQHWSRPASARNGMKATLQLNLVPTGEVINVSVIESSGSATFDRSAVAAVKRAKQFSDLQQLPLKLFNREFRRFRMTFNPEDLRR
jgi:colicin import membrane protein